MGRRERCHWREFELMQELLKRSLLPRMLLHEAVKNWHAIRRRLAEPPRKRIKQRRKLGFI